MYPAARAKPEDACTRWLRASSVIVSFAITPLISSARALISLSERRGVFGPVALSAENAATAAETSRIKLAAIEPAFLIYASLIKVTQDGWLLNASGCASGTIFGCHSC